MAAFPAAVVLFLYFTSISGYTLSQDDHELIWPTEYHFKGEMLDLISSRKDTFEIWYSKELKRSRIDYYDSVKIWYYGDTRRIYTKSPVTTEEVTNEERCTYYIPSPTEKIDQLIILPAVSHFNYTGTTTLYDKVVDVWSVKLREKEKDYEDTLYSFKTDYGVDVPVQRVKKNANCKNGKVTLHRIIKYFDFRDTVTKEELSVDDESKCVKTWHKRMTTDQTFSHHDNPTELDMAFESYSKRHNKQYQDEEHQMRKMIFEKNWRMVEEHNRKNLSYKIELNEFSDQTEDELTYLSGTYIDDVPTELDFDVQIFPHTQAEIETLVEELPENFDLRLEGVITPVKSQGPCGSCWAFCTTAAIEGALTKVNGGRLLDLSEQSVVDCAWGFGTKGCHGGQPYKAMQYVLTHGIPTEMDYGLYKAKDGYCHIQNMTSPYKIRGYAQVTPGNPNALKLALYKYGPVTSTIYVTPTIHHYSSGLYDESSCKEKIVGLHCVTVIGYGVHDGEDYWLVKNSWGDNWGLNGYIMMHAKNSCLLDKYYYPIV